MHGNSNIKYIEYLRISVYLVGINIVLIIINCKRVPGGWRQILFAYLPPVEEVPVSKIHAMPVFFRAEQKTVRKSVKQHEHVR